MDKDKDKDKVYVILSTYNGEQFLKPQLQSILEQESVRVQLQIRDDGSNDASKEILSSYTQQYANISVSYGVNIGVIKSFMKLLEQLPPDAEYIAFADQDDIWRTDKLVRAIDKIKAKTGPVMYCSCYRAVDERGELLWESKIPPGEITFCNAVIENITTGCTVVINKNLLRLLAADQVDCEKLVMHDWWVYMVATCFGHVIYDSMPLVFYRQHAGNVVGVKNGFTFWLGRLQRFLFQGQKNSRISQASEFLRIYQRSLSCKNADILTEFISYRQKGLFERAHYALGTPVYMQKRLDNWIVKLQLLIRNVN